MHTRIVVRFQYEKKSSPVQSSPVIVDSLLSCGFTCSTWRAGTNSEMDYWNGTLDYWNGTLDWATGTGSYTSTQCIYFTNPDADSCFCLGKSVAMCLFVCICVPPPKL